MQPAWSVIIDAVEKKTAFVRQMKRRAAPNCTRAMRAIEAGPSRAILRAPASATDWPNSVTCPVGAYH